jgi:hypothetical protein
MQIKSPGGASYVITFIDEFSMRIVIIFLMKKYEIASWNTRFLLKNRHEINLKHKD